MRRLKMLRTAILAVLFLVAANILMSEKVAANQKELADSLIRFHVRANSDSDEDQELKLKVRDAVVDYMEVLLCESQSAKQSQEIIANNMEDILGVAMQVIHDNGYQYDLSGYIVEEYFPLRTYGDIALPPGEYTAFRIDIGEAQGRNWWCVLYPSLCFVDVTHGVVPDESKAEFQKIADETGAQVTTTYSVEFKYLKFLNEFLE